MVEETKSFSFNVKISKIGSGVGIYLRKEDGWDERHIGLDATLTCNRDAPPVSKEEKIDSDITTKIDAYVKSCNGIYANVFCKMMTNKGHPELINIDNVKMFITIKKDVQMIKNERWSELERQQDEVKQELEKIIVTSGGEDFRTMNKEYLKELKRHGIDYDENKHSIIETLNLNSRYKEKQYIVVIKDQEARYPELIRKQESLENDERQVDSYVISKIKEKFPSAHPLVIEVALEDKASERLIEERSNLMLKQLAQPGSFQKTNGKELDVVLGSLKQKKKRNKN